MRLNLGFQTKTNKRKKQKKKKSLEENATLGSVNVYEI